MTQDIQGILKGVPFKVLSGDPATAVTGIAYNSSAVIPGDVFFCVVGMKSDGHDYAQDALQRGAVALVVQRPLDLDIPQFQVEDSRHALALAASNLFDRPSESLKVVGVTGTNGKTTTTYLLEWIARCAGLKTGVIGTVETRIGDQRLKALHTTPESRDLQALLAEMRDAQVDLVAMEVSSHAIALDRVAGTRFACVAFSNLTQDHLDFHGTMEEYFAAKAALFHYPDVAARVVCIEDDYGRRLAEDCRSAGLPLLTVGRCSDADVQARQMDYQASGTRLELVTPEGVSPLSFPLIGAFNVQNLLVAVGVAMSLDIPLSTIIQALESAPQVPGRLERVTVEGDLPFSVFVDYAHTPDSIEKALSAVRAVTPGQVHIVFGCGGDRDATKRPLMGAAACAADHLVVTSDNPRSEDPDAIIAQILPGITKGDACLVEPDRARAIAAALEAARPGDAVLIAGKGHEDYQLVGDEVLHFDDREVAAQCLECLLKGKAGD